MCNTCFVQSWELRARRRAAELTLKQVARAAGTTESNVAAYERGKKTPNLVTRKRLLSMLDAGATSPIFINNLMTVAETASAMRDALRKGSPTIDTLRLVRQMVSDSKWIQSRGDHEAFYAQPSTTGDPRWDAMLSGVVEHLHLIKECAPPVWTAGSALDHFWFVGTDPAFDAISFASTPTSLRIRGVVLDAAALESV